MKPGDLLVGRSEELLSSFRACFTKGKNLRGGLITGFSDMRENFTGTENLTPDWILELENKTVWTNLKQEYLTVISNTRWLLELMCKKEERIYSKELSRLGQET